MLTSAANGNQPQLRCQYHGWEFDDRGCTAKIPDSRCFRPWDRENSRLNMFRLESCGDLLFVSLNPNVIPLREWMDPFYEETEQGFSSPMWNMRHVWEYDCTSNWKVPVENTLESYHIPAMHQKSIGNFLPPEDNIEHFLHERYTALSCAADSEMEMAQVRLNRWLGGKPTLKHLHRHIHPNTILVASDTFSYALMYLPTSPTTVRIRVRMFALRGTRRGPLASLVSWVAWQIGKSKTLKIQKEDLGIYASQQTGLERSRHPGVIGSREERLYVFQKYILETLGLPLPPDPASPVAIEAPQ
jgi:phenylpropionate dioxygenase-like ring-hydroxylating dioxygenase large terminal subunit